MWVKFEFARVQACVVVEYSPTEGDEERKMFWKDSNKILNREYRFCGGIFDG